MRPERALAVAGIVIGTVIIGGGLAAEFAGGKTEMHRHVAVALSPASTSTTSSTFPGGWRAVVPATTVPADTPVQQQYDKGFEAGFSSAANEAMMMKAEALPLASPADTGGWPALAVSSTPEGWAAEFVSALLNIDFARQSRAAAGAWLVAEEAPDLMPGIPPGFQDRALYVSLMEPSITGQPSPLPSATKWDADAVAGVRWVVSDLQVQLDPQWQKMIDAGWQPPDIRAAVEDVSGVLTASRRTGRTGRTSRRFSMVLQVGSARFMDGYGSVLVSGWTEP